MENVTPQPFGLRAYQNPTYNETIQASRFRVETGCGLAYTAYAVSSERSPGGVFVNFEATVLQDSPYEDISSLPVIKSGGEIELTGFGVFTVEHTGHSDARIAKV